MPDGQSSHAPRRFRALLVGFFQTIGDLECLYAVEAQLAADGRAYDIAPYRDHIREAIPGAIDLTDVVAGDYTHVFVICGPCTPAFLEKFGVDRLFGRGLRFVGVNLTMVHPLTEWNPFDVLIERDSAGSAFPDLTFAMDTERTPVVSTCFIEGQGEYGDRQRHSDVIDAVDRFLLGRDFARVVVDTRWPREKNAAGLASPEQIISVIARTDVLITNRLHGLVFALKAGVPVVALDSVAGGGKVSQQAACLGWPVCIAADEISEARLASAIAWCLSAEARDAATAAYAIGKGHDHRLAEQFAVAYALPPAEPAPPASKPSRLTRLVKRVVGRRG